MIHLLPFLFCLFLLQALTNGRHPISSHPLPAPPSQPTSVSIQSMAPPPITMQIVVVERRHHYHKELALSIALASVAVGAIILSALCVWVLWRRDREGSDTKDVGSGPVSSNFNPMSNKGLVAMFDYTVLVSATNSFDNGDVLGDGRFGCVYKALFEGGILAVVKKFEGGGQDCEREFENELDLLGGIRHPNIVSLLGYCVHGETRFIVYEMMSNGSLESQLNGPSHGSTLTWHVRMKIALDAARGLEYLHEHCNPPVIHRNLKLSNILLDSDFNAKISDFGLAVTGGDQTKCGIKLPSTQGYAAPEYTSDGKLTEKSDVYAFGVILLELLIGWKPVEKMPPSQGQSIVALAMPQLTDRSKLPDIVDPIIRNTMDVKHLYQVAAVAVLCVQPEPSYRPLITDVLHSLIPLVPTELGGTLRVGDHIAQNTSAH